VTGTQSHGQTFASVFKALSHPNANDFLPSVRKKTTPDSEPSGVVLLWNS
jgi:hypothetical protein